ncbi:MAG: N-carbamoylputrescine amidase [Desulfobacterales bacterium]|nr:N-carbamoylputrescine amidase [Desulfobacterales bacterium]
MAIVKIAVTQMKCSDNIKVNVDKAEILIRKSAKAGAHIILLQELFMTPYFCQDIDPEYLNYAEEADNHPVLARMAGLAKELSVVLPISFFEKANRAYFNSLMMIDADGKSLGLYRKTHIPDHPKYYEKFYFNPGDTGFKVFKTQYGKIGIGICWDQWFPESARILSLMGADVIFYPTAIGADVENFQERLSRQWQRVMQGHAAANIVPVCAANRIGEEQGHNGSMTFFGSSFIANEIGEKTAEAGYSEEKILTADFDFQEIEQVRKMYEFFRDRRPSSYQPLMTLDGNKSGIF